MGNASGSRVNLPQPAAEHSSHHDRSGHSGSAHGGSAHGGSTHGGVHGGGGGGRRTPGGLSSAQQTWQRSGATVVRMVRTKKKHKKEKGSKAPGASTLPSAELASASAEATADAAAAAGGAGTTPLAGELLDRADSAPPAMASQGALLCRCCWCRGPWGFQLTEAQHHGSIKCLLAFPAKS